MKSCKCMVLFTVLAIAALTTGVASAQNVLVNGDFETGDLTGWVVAGGNASATVSVQSGDNGPSLIGTNNAFMENFGEALGLTLKQTTPVGSATAGQIDYAFDLKLDQADIGGVFFVEIFAEKDGAGIVGGSGLLGPFWAWNAWSTFSGSFMAPVGTDFLTIQFEAVTGAAIGTNCVAHVDNAIIMGSGTVAEEAQTWSNVKAMYR